MTAPKPLPFPVVFARVPCPRCGAPMNEPEGASLRKAREVYGVGLNEMARLLGCSAAYLSDVELGRRRVTRKVLAQYGEVLR